MTEPMQNSERPSARVAIWRGLRGLCPACGEGKLFKSYLSPSPVCGHCGADLSHIRSEDGPSWFTILLLGPILVPIALLVSMSGWSPLIIIPLAGGLVIGSVMLALPRVKGAFIGALYLAQSPERDDDT